MSGQRYDLIIIGSGPAGASAAIYGGRAMLRTLVLDGEASSGQISITEEVVNYPGILKISGAELVSNLTTQAQNFGAEIVHEEVESVDFSGELKKVRTTKGTEFEAVAVVIATGAKPRTIGFPGEKEFTGRGVGYCATCDGEFFTGMDIFVIGGGFAAAEEAVFLTRYGKHVHVIVRDAAFSCSQSIAEEVLAHKDITVHFQTETVEIGGDTVLRHATFKNTATNEIWNYTVDSPSDSFGVFVFAGYVPQSSLFQNTLTLDEQGYILTDEDMATNIPGIYAAGDIRPKKLRQLATAVSDGAIAATIAEKYIHTTKEKHNIVVTPPTKDSDKASSPKDSFLDQDLVAGLQPILDRFQKKITLQVTSSPENEKLSRELESFASDFADLSDKISYQALSQDVATDKDAAFYPVLSILDADNQPTGVYFHGVPGGHEFNSFVIATYNAAGPGQEISQTIRERIQALPATTIEVGATLSCVMCPDVVQAAQLIALHNPSINAHMIDISQFSQFREEHHIMSVPAVVVNNGDVSFGKKSLEEMLDLLEHS